MKKNKFLSMGLITGTLSLIAVSAAIFSSGSVKYHQFDASGPVDWKHFSAVMPTETTQGVREYWIDCGTEKTPHFVKPAGISAVDATLTQTQIDQIMTNPKDERIIPTLAMIQKGVTKGYDGSSAFHHDFVEAAFAYNYLDSTTKGLITGWSEAKGKAKAEWDKRFKVVYDAGKDSLPIVEQPAYTWAKSFDDDYGYVFTITTKQMEENEGVQFYSYGYNIPGVTYNSTDKIHFAICSPFSALAGTSQTAWCGNYGTAKKIGLNEGWNKVNEFASDLNSDGSFNTSFTGALSIQRYINTAAVTVPTYSGVYKLSSIYAENLTDDGAIVLSTLNDLVALPNGSWPDTSTITKNVSTDYGTAVQIDIPNKTSALEFKWSGVEIKRAQAFDYLTFYVYAPVSNEAFFISQKDWRNAVMNVSGLPSDGDNGTKANTAATDTAILAQGWNKISLPVQNFEDNNYSPAGTLYFELWARTTGEQNGWLVTDIKGYKTPDHQAVPASHGYSFTGSVESFVESSYPDVPFYKVSASATKVAGRFATVVNQPTNLSKYTSVKFIVKGPRAGNFALFYDFATNVWWPIGGQVTPGIAADSYTEITYSASDVNAGFSWKNLKMGLLFTGSGNDATGDWYVGIQLIK